MMSENDGMPLYRPTTIFPVRMADTRSPASDIRAESSSTTAAARSASVSAFCPEPLSHLHYDITNAAGWFTNLPVQVVDQTLDTNMTAFTTNKLTLQDNTTNTLIYEYNPSSAQLTRQSGSTTTVLLQQCDYLSFEIFQRTLAFRSKRLPWRLLDSTLTRWILVRQSARALANLKQVLEDS